MRTRDPRALKVVQIACAAAADGSPMLWALTEDGRIWFLQSGTWLEEPDVVDER